MDTPGDLSNAGVGREEVVGQLTSFASELPHDEDWATALRPNGPQEAVQIVLT